MLFRNISKKIKTGFQCLKSTRYGVTVIVFVLRFRNNPPSRLPVHKGGRYVQHFAKSHANCVSNLGLCYYKGMVSRKGQCICYLLLKFTPGYVQRHFFKFNPPSKYSIQHADCMRTGGVESCWRPYSAGFYTLYVTRFRITELGCPPQDLGVEGVPNR